MKQLMSNFPTINEKNRLAALRSLPGLSYVEYIPISTAKSRWAGDNMITYSITQEYQPKDHKVLDHDLDEIAEGFLKFAKEQK